MDGVATTYLTDGSPARTTLPDGTTTSYTLWPDGTRRSATTTDADGTTTVTYHYGIDGIPVNDSTSDGSTPAGTATTASYLLTAGREARTLLSGTAPSGKVTGTPAAPIDTGTGVGYYLRDRHTSVSGLVDRTGTVTATYAYADYGTPARADGRPVNQGTFDGGRTNPYTYLGASPRGPLTEASSGLLAFAERTYDPRQGRFTSPDPVDAHNLYQGFNANPITYLDLSGQMSTTDIVLEALFAVVMVVSAVLTAGAAAAAIGAVAAAVEVGAEVAATVVVNVVANVVATTANIVGAVAEGVAATNDIKQTVTGQGFLSDDQRNTVLLVGTVAGAVAGAAGFASAATDSAAQGLVKAAENGFAPDYVPGPTGVDAYTLSEPGDPVRPLPEDVPINVGTEDGDENIGSTDADSDETSAKDVGPNSNDDLIQSDPEARWRNWARNNPGKSGDDYYTETGQWPVDGGVMWTNDGPVDVSVEPPASDPNSVTSTGDLITTGEGSTVTPAEEPGTSGDLDDYENINILDEKSTQ